jgi:pyruvate carboxylase
MAWCCEARSLGFDTRLHEVARAYRAANDLFGDIVKVTPSSKVVGDMALMMVSQGLRPQDVVDPQRDIAFPASVVEMMQGDELPIGMTSRNADLDL